MAFIRIVLTISTFQGKISESFSSCLMGIISYPAVTVRCSVKCCKVDGKASLCLIKYHSTKTNWDVTEYHSEF